MRYLNVRYSDLQTYCYIVLNFFSTLDRILQTNQSSNVIADDWLGHPEVSGSNPPTPSTSQHILHPDGGNVLLRGDTLDRNPGFINPHEIETSSWSNTTSYVNRQVKGRSKKLSRKKSFSVVLSVTQITS
jgi:hypothetical protein